MADYTRALRIVRRLPRRDPQRRTVAARIILNRANMLRSMGEYSQALKDCRAAITEFGRASPSLPAPELVAAQYNSGCVLADLGRFPDALECLAAAERAYVELGRQGPPYEVEIIQVRLARAATLLDSGDSTAALSATDRVMAGLQRLVESGRSESEWLLALAQRNRGLIHLARSAWNPALEDLDRARHSFEHLFATGRVDLEGYVADCLVCRSRALLETGLSERARADRDRGLSLLRVLIMRGEPETRVMYFRRCFECATQLAAAAPADSVQLMEHAVREAERGMAEGRAVEALRIEADRARQLLVRAGLHGRFPAVERDLERLTRAGRIRRFLFKTKDLFASANDAAD
jgi:tetratricopeptide (TPR) repeat protein